MKRLLISLSLLTGITAATLTLAEPASKAHLYSHQCGSGVSLVITDADRFDPLVQQLLLKQQLSGHPVIDSPRFVVIPTSSDAALTEMQIRYLEQLLSKAKPE
ncbi:MAG: hypothetical protein V7752_02520 [Halopseudomonas sp.]